ncbi:hypothetical protein [Paenibacillus tuaregi]|uniref:hypothetical protein n=1 Tax=Paenibacillus tuaregi TaxID=1816681 RepID=UPI00083852A9|nr:hypothetical protein [Paenibacillus tuaregi]
MKRKGYLYYLIWTIGAILLLYYGNQYLDEIARKGQVDFNIKRSLWAGTLFALILGIYLSGLFGLPGRASFNKPMFLAVFLPSFVLLVYVVAAFYFKLPLYPKYLKLIDQHGHFYLGVISGISLIKSLFETRR